MCPSWTDVSHQISWPRSATRWQKDQSSERYSQSPLSIWWRRGRKKGQNPCLRADPCWQKGMVSASSSSMVFGMAMKPVET